MTVAERGASASFNNGHRILFIDDAGTDSQTPMVGGTYDITWNPVLSSLNINDTDNPIGGLSAGAGCLSIKQSSTTVGKSGIFLVRNANDDNVWNLYRSGTHMRFAYSTNATNSSPTWSGRGFLAADGGDGQLNFTGQHRSDSAEELKSEENVGLIVVSKGVFKNTDGTSLPSINESLPDVELSTVDNCKRVFGVISDSEDSESTRSYQWGPFGCDEEKVDGVNRLIINSVGEGAVWVCDINGNLDNGDYITTCTVPGHGALQGDDLLHNYTVAKITQDCTFDLNSTEYVCEEYEHNGAIYKRAFVGCTYHCG